MQIEAEKLVLAANGKQGLATVAIRPSGIFGEWDRVLVPQLVDKAKQGKMKYIIGNGNNLMEFTYAKNVADAHVLVSIHIGCSKYRSLSFMLHFSLFVRSTQVEEFYNWSLMVALELLRPASYPRRLEPHLCLCADRTALQDNKHTLESNSCSNLERNLLTCRQQASSARLAISLGRLIL